MKVVASLRSWWQVHTGDETTPFDRDSAAFLGSFLIHLGILLALGFASIPVERNESAVTITAPAIEEEVEYEPKIAEEFAISDHPLLDIGANSEGGTLMAMSSAAVLDQLSDVPHPADLPVIATGEIVVNNDIQIATGSRIDNVAVRGAAGEGTTGATGAIDRITKDILLSLEERKTLVVWFFDQSGSLNRQRSEIRQRFDRVYQELGIIEAAGNPAFKRHDDKPLLTAVVAFGKGMKFMTEKPTDNLSEITSAVEAIEQDDSGLENVFSAVFTAAEKYRKYRQEEPARNVMFVVFSDEVGDDPVGLDKTVNICRRSEIPVYVVGIPAPFGFRETFVKYVDPDPKYDQTPQFIPVSQGPETLLPESIRLQFSGGTDPNPMDSGFGPYALTRLCYETGGIYFTVHPNRNVNREVRRGEIDDFTAHLKHFFDPNVMRKYRPEYVSTEEYGRRVAKSKARMSLVKAAEMSQIGQLESPNVRFLKVDEAAFSNALTEAQKAAAILEPRLNTLFEVLRLGEADRAKETVPRWQAGFDLAIGRVLAAKVRAEGYNAMLAAAKRGLKFTDSKSNTWVLEPANEFTTGSQLAKAGEQAKTYLDRVVKDHPDTPWAMLAQLELQTPLGWRWKEEITDIPRPVAREPGNNAAAAPARPRPPAPAPMPPPKRPPPKL